MKHKLVVFLSVLILGFSFAENRALIIGISEYANPSANIPGPDVDIRLMTELATRMGFESHQIQTLADSQATKGQIISEFETWLINSTTPQDKVLFFYSGHGAQIQDANGDENDGCDEVLIPYDIDSAGNNSIVDDDIARLLNRIPAQEVLVIIDSCFSGTATKALLYEEDELAVTPTSKFYKSFGACNVAVNQPVTRDIGVIPPGGLNNSGSTATSPETAGRDNVFGLSAAADNQVALGAFQPGMGSAFTQALYDSVMQNSGQLTFVELQQHTSEWIRTRLEAESLGHFTHNPSVFGEQALTNRPFYSFIPQATVITDPTPVIPAPPVVTTGSEIHADLISDITDTSQFEVHIKPTKTEYRLGEIIEFDVVSSKDGYLNIIDFGASGNITVLFPNQYYPDNYVRANEVLKVPSLRLGMDFQLAATGTTGQSRVLAVVSTDPLSLYGAELKNLASGDISFLSINVNSVPAAATAITRDIGVFQGAIPNQDVSNTPQHGAATIPVMINP